MISTFGKNIKVTIFGGSHEPEIGVTIEGFPKEALTFDKGRLQSFLDLRAPGNGHFVTERKEPDIFEIKSTDPLTLVIKNHDQKSEDYETFSDIPRPGHADYTAGLRYPRMNMAGGGPFSGRMTAPLCMAGGITLEYIQKTFPNVCFGAHILRIGAVTDAAPDYATPNLSALDGGSFYAGDTAKDGIPVFDPAARTKMTSALAEAMRQGDSLGGIVEVFVTGFPGGIGGAMYDGLESILAPIFFGIPAVKGIEFGAGINAAAMRGSENNDSFAISSRGNIVTTTNNAGGILGGITTGMPLIAGVAFKPTPSIAKEQQTVNLKTGEKERLSVQGRHDPCVAIRAVPAVVAATALGILDALAGQNFLGDEVWI